MRDPSKFRERFALYKLGKSPYKNGQIIEYKDGKDEIATSLKEANVIDKQLSMRYIRFLENADSAGFNKKLNRWELPKNSTYDKHQLGIGLDIRKGGAAYDYLKSKGRLNNPYLTVEEERRLRAQAYKNKKGVVDRFYKNNKIKPTEKDAAILSGMAYHGHPMKMLNTVGSLTRNAVLKRIDKHKTVGQQAFNFYYTYGDNATRYKDRYLKHIDFWKKYEDGKEDITTVGLHIADNGDIYSAEGQRLGNTVVLPEVTVRPSWVHEKSRMETMANALDKYVPLFNPDGSRTGYNEPGLKIVSPEFDILPLGATAGRYLYTKLIPLYELWPTFLKQGENTLTRFIGTGDSGFKDALTSKIIRGNPRPAIGTAREIHKNAKKLRDIGASEKDIRAYSSNNIESEEQYLRLHRFFEKIYNPEVSEGAVISRSRFALKKENPLDATYQEYLDEMSKNRRLLYLMSLKHDIGKAPKWSANWNGNPMATFAREGENLFKSGYVGDYAVLIRNANKYAVDASAFGHFHSHPTTEYPMPWNHEDVAFYKLFKNPITKRSSFGVKLPDWYVKYKYWKYNK